MNNCRLLPSELVLQNFRSFRNVSIPLGRRLTVVSGANGVGKSNIISLIASGSGISKKSSLGSNFQPEFSDFFHIDESENYQNYSIFLKYSETNGNYAFTKRLSFKDDTNSNRGIRIIPRITKEFSEKNTIKEASTEAKNKYGIGDSGRVLIPTIYLSLSRLYPLGERKGSTKVTEIRKSDPFAKKVIMSKYRDWYNSIIPGSIPADAEITLIEKQTCIRSSLHMDMNNIPTLSQSIGQDSIGNIVSALIDIYNLSLKESYTGALLCIDEIDVSLHPDTQVKLLDLLDKLSQDLNIQIIVSTHSLTILKTCLEKEKKHAEEYKVIYLKNPSSPLVSNQKDYYLLKQDLFGKLSYDRLRVKIYFEDEVGEELFNELISAFRIIYSDVKNKNKVLRNFDKARNYQSINDRILSYKDMVDILDSLNLIVTHCGCDELLQLVDADKYFNRVIVMLDGDARIKEKTKQPMVRDYLDSFFNPKDIGANERNHKPNIIFAPGYFAPESYYYKLIMNIAKNENDYLDFWRSMDNYESTALYTSEKIRNLFASLSKDFTNDDLKQIFKEDMKSEIWEFIKNTSLLYYVYSDYLNVNVLLDFIDKLKKAYDMTLPNTLANRYV